MGYDAYVHIKKKYTKSAIEKLLMLMKYEKMGDAFYCGNDKEYKLYTGVYVWMCDQNKEELKSDVEYTRDKTVQYIKAKNMILEYLQTNDQITSAKIQEMCGFTKQQARSVIDKMRSEGLITLTGKGPAARYVMFKELSDN